MRKNINVYEKYVAPRVEPWVTPLLTGSSCKDLPPELLESTYSWEKAKQGKITDLKFRNIWVCEEDQHAAPHQSLEYISRYS